MKRLPAKLMRIPKFKEWDGTQVSPAAWEIRCDLITDGPGTVMACLWYITGDQQHIKFLLRFSQLEATKPGFVDRHMRLDASSKQAYLPALHRHPALCPKLIEARKAKRREQQRVIKNKWRKNNIEKSRRLTREGMRRFYARRKLEGGDL